MGMCAFRSPTKANAMPFCRHARRRQAYGEGRRVLARHPLGILQSGCPDASSRPWSSEPAALRRTCRDVVLEPNSIERIGSRGMRSRHTRVSSRRPSLQDVAKLAGVSSAAVSYVVNGRTREVSAKTREEIESAIATLRYQPQRRGLSLKFNREFAIGLVVLDPNPSFLADPFTTQVATGLSNFLNDLGYGLTVTGCGSVDKLQQMLNRPIGVDALVVIASGPVENRRSVYRAMSDTSLPVVVVQDETDLEDGCAIGQDDLGGAQALTRHLLAAGARRFLFVAPACVWPAVERREAGIRQALPEGCSFFRTDCDEHDFEATSAAIDRCLDERALPDAIMGANDQIAIAALRVLDRRGIIVPRDVQVTGYNDFAFRHYVTPHLTTVASRAVDIGRSCGQAILARLDGDAFDERRIVFPVSLDLGGTTRSDAAPVPLRARSARP